ncbi:MAG: hypothetical protein FWC41_02360 [Firmicutes bacterium]|nr:hypothetical protein [Bacillota bacterium]
MKFFTVREIQKNPSKVWSGTKKHGQSVITRNGKPDFLLVNINEESLEKIYDKIISYKGLLAFENMQKHVSEQDFITDEEINEEIYNLRKEKNKRQEK